MSELTTGSAVRYRARAGRATTDPSGSQYAETERHQQVDRLAGEALRSALLALSSGPAGEAGHDGVDLGMQLVGIEPPLAGGLPETVVSIRRSARSRANWWALPAGAGKRMSVATPVRIDRQNPLGPLLDLEARLGRPLPQPPLPARAGRVVPLNAG